jgi:hypothetical protein
MLHSVQCGSTECQAVSQTGLGINNQLRLTDMERGSETLQVLNPVAQVDVEKVTVAGRVTVLTGKKIGLCSNRKPGSATALNRIAELLSGQFTGLTFERFDFPTQFPPEAIPQMADSGCDAIISASAD